MAVVKDVLFRGVLPSARDSAKEGRFMFPLRGFDMAITRVTGAKLLVNGYSRREVNGAVQVSRLDVVELLGSADRIWEVKADTTPGTGPVFRLGVTAAGVASAVRLKVANPTANGQIVEPFNHYLSSPIGGEHKVDNAAYDNRPKSLA